MKYRTLICLFYLSICASLLCSAQPNLVLMKPGKVHHIFYQVGDRITYKDKISGSKISGMIMNMTDSTIELAHAPRINIKNIETIYRTRHFFSQGAAAGIVVLGVYVPISMINNAVHNEPLIRKDDVIYLFGPMLAVSGISWLLLVHKYQVGEKWQLKVMDFGHPVYN
ncbi:MAG: hypothetical protein HXX13_12840 [Bacteroidetes bacterium]|nr:hypothetical protein [Bacteroidota bacterium]